MLDLLHKFVTWVMYRFRAPYLEIVRNKFFYRLILFYAATSVFLYI